MEFSGHINQTINLFIYSIKKKELEIERHKESMTITLNKSYNLDLFRMY
jgi:hypothetical protein